MRNIWITSTTMIATAFISQFANADAFGFDRPGSGFGTEIVPLGHVAWEQSFPTASYDEQYADGEKQSTLSLQADALMRIGLGSDLELRLGWDGPMWQRVKTGTVKNESNGLGDVNIGLKKAIDTHDDQFKWAVLAQATLATGNDEFSNEKDIYTLGSALNYQFNDDISTSMTLYYDYQDGDLAWSAIPGLQYTIVDRLAGFSEYVYRKQESQHFESSINNGLIWSFKDNLQIDGWIGYSFNQQNPRYSAGLGIAYLF